MQNYLTAEISASAVRKNLETLRGLLQPGTKLCPAVKANCYGLGIGPLLGVISELADCVAVAAPQEAIELRDCGYERPILLMLAAGAFDRDKVRRESLRELVAASVTFTLVSDSDLADLAEAAADVGAEAEVHIMIDTGMGRSGVRFCDAPELIAKAREAEHIRLAGLYTHFATSDEADKTFTQLQFDRFLQTVEAAGGHAGLTLHVANSAAIIDLPETHLDMVRPGIAVYGYQPSDGMHTKISLRPALRLCGRLTQVKDIPAGERCGYGLTHGFDADARIGLVSVGYADGYMRRLSNRATMRVRGRDVPVRGRVSMDQTIVELTGVPEAQVGDEVEIYSNDPEAPHCVENIARLAGTIPNEIITSLNGRVHRVLVD